MSDFGSMIIFKKKEGQFTADDEKEIADALKKIITRDQFPPHIAKGDFTILRGLEDDSYCSLISEYYMDEDSDDLKEFAEEEDMEDCERILDALQATLGQKFEMEAKFLDW